MNSLFAQALAFLILFVAHSPALPCSLCSNLRLSPTLRDDAASAKVVIYGPVSNPRLTGETAGVTDLHVEAIIKSHPIIAGKKVVELPRYLPAGDTDGPPRFLIFCDVSNGKLDPYRGVIIKPAVVDYLKGALAIDPNDRAKLLLYSFNYLDHSEKEIAQDAFMEFVRANDREIGRIAGKLPAGKLRAWIKDPQTPASACRSMRSFSAPAASRTMPPSSRLSCGIRASVHSPAMTVS